MRSRLQVLQSQSPLAADGATSSPGASSLSSSPFAESVGTSQASEPPGDDIVSAAAAGMSTASLLRQVRQNRLQSLLSDGPDQSRAQADPEAAVQRRQVGALSLQAASSTASTDAADRPPTKRGRRDNDDDGPGMQ